MYFNDHLCDAIDGHGNKNLIITQLVNVFSLPFPLGVQFLFPILSCFTVFLPTHTDTSSYHTVNWNTYPGYCPSPVKTMSTHCKPKLRIHLLSLFRLLQCHEMLLKGLKANWFIWDQCSHIWVCIKHFQYGKVNIFIVQTFKDHCHIIHFFVDMLILTMKKSDYNIKCWKFEIICKQKIFSYYNIFSINHHDYY